MFWYIIIYYILLLLVFLQFINGLIDNFGTENIDRNLPDKNSLQILVALNIFYLKESTINSHEH
jgi:hypothetical protein